MRSQSTYFSFALACSLFSIGTALADGPIIVVPGGGPQPRPTNTPNPIPTIVVPGGGPGGGHTTIPPTTTTIIDLQRPWIDGQQQALSPGSREGREAGEEYGRREGESVGYRDGFARCEQQERERAQNRGYEDGFPIGEQSGRSKGQSDGEREGLSNGQSQGTAQGRSEADEASRNAAWPIGSAQGQAQADRSSAAEVGRQDGIKEGDQDARERSNAVDYKAARKKIFEAMYAEAVQSQDQFSQKASQAPASLLQLIEENQDISQSLLSTNSGGSPNYSYSNPRCNYPTYEETRACREGYRDGYNEGFQNAYSSAYDSAYNVALRNSSVRGCDDARRRDYSDVYNAGKRSGTQDGYQRQYQPNYQAAYEPAYRKTFEPARRASYQGSYQELYNKHLEEARSKAYDDRYHEIYRAAYNSVYQGSFNSKYPGYAAEATQRGLADEKADFEARPVRFLDASLIQAENTGLFEPTQEMQVNFVLRNFAGSNINSKDVQLHIESLSGELIVVSQADSLLNRGLKAKSVTSVANALSFRAIESGVDKELRVRVSASYRGKAIGSKTLSFTPSYMITSKVAETLPLAEGLPGVVKLAFTNRSKVATDAGFQAQVGSATKTLEVIDKSVAVGVIQPGETRIVEVHVIPRTTEDTVNFKLLVDSKLGSGRRVGLDGSEGSGVIHNDYEMETISDLYTLRSSGVTRVNYRIFNISSGQVMKSLQLYIRFKDPSGKATDQFQVIGPNPQFLKPVDKDKMTSFFFPVMARSQNDGGTIELELREDGRAVVIHTASF